MKNILPLLVLGAAIVTQRSAFAQDPAAPPAAGTAPVTAEPAPAPSPPAPPTPPPAAAATLPRKLAVGTDGTFTPGLLLQGWYRANFADGGDFNNTFRMRRAEITAKGEIIPKLIAYSVMINPAKLLDTQSVTIPTPNADPMQPQSVTIKQPGGSLALLQDLYFTYQSVYADVSMGSFKIPVSWEGYNSSGKLLFPERALISSTFGDIRDLGIRIAKTFDWFGYSAGLFNGTGAANLDANRAKDAALRLELYPVKGLMVGGVIYGSIGQRGQAGTKDRFEGDLRYDGGPFLFQAEFIRAHDVPKDVAVDAQGFYTAAAFMVVPKLQLAARLGLFDPNVDKDNDQIWTYEGTINYYLQGQEARLQLSYSRYNYRVADDINELIFATQIFF